MDDAGYVLLVMGLVGLLVSIGLNVFLVWTLMRAARRLRAVGHLVEEMRAKVRERRGR